VKTKKVYWQYCQQQFQYQMHFSFDQIKNQIMNTWLFFIKAKLDLSKLNHFRLKVSPLNYLLQEQRVRLL